MANEQLGRKVHNLLLAMSDDDFQKYGRLVGMILDFLLFDVQNIPLAIKHDNAHDIYWYELHYNWLHQVEAEFTRIFKTLSNKKIVLKLK